MKRIHLLLAIILGGIGLSSNVFAQLAPENLSGDTVFIDMVALDQPFMYNRMGAAQPTGMIFALTSDVEAKRGSTLAPGNVQLRNDKRPRPIVLRCNKGDILVIKFTNYLRPYRANDTVQFYPNFGTHQGDVNSIYPATREAGVHILGMQLVNSIADDASNVGSNASSLAKPGETKTYTLFAGEEGAFILHSTADDLGDGTIRAGQISNGLFGSLNVQPPTAEWYRSQVTADELYAATDHWINEYNQKVEKPQSGDKDFEKKTLAYQLNAPGFPMINYDATDANGKPIIKMYEQLRPNARRLVHSDLTAIIAGPEDGFFPLGINDPAFSNVPAQPNRRQPFREFSIHYHEAPYAVQSFPVFYDENPDTIANVTQTLQGGVDQFAINYGTGGIGAEIFANRIGVGPMANCIDCMYEEFFLSAWAVGDPAQVVDIPANAAADIMEREREKKALQSVNETLQEQMLREAALLNGDLEGPVASQDNTIVSASKAYFPDDPSNVYHSYMNDRVKFRINHTGAGITHVHHQHAHQWLHSPNSDKGHYLDSQTIDPGSSYTLEITHNGSGNLNKTVGDQIFHCHFYPHFAQGMWSMWRVHDVLETGSVLDKANRPVEGTRALPDAEIKTGTPIPGLVPMPGLAMAPIPGKVAIKDGQAVLFNDSRSPGYPFYIPGVAGQRPPHPPMDYAIGPRSITDENGNTIDLGEGAMSGGLPRKVTIGGTVPFENHTKYDWTKITDSLKIVALPEDGTYYEKLAMKAHATRTHQTLTPSGRVSNFTLNGLPPAPGAPYADPAIDANGIAVGKVRRYKAANIQIDAVLNKEGWHYPQQRPIVLWGDVASTVAGDRPPQPFFFRANSGEYIEYWHTNLVPEYYELDDFQVRTPTDVIGQHIHLVKFDVTSSDGAANGWNYEDGSLSSKTVRDQIEQINKGDYLSPPLNTGYTGSIVSRAERTNRRGQYLYKKDTTLVPYNPLPVWGKAPKNQDWTGAQTTIQRWYSDPLFDNEGNDRTLRTVFTHDHFGPSTHQQIGLYAGLLIEPNGSTWKNPENGSLLGFAELDTTRNVPTTYRVDPATGVPTATATMPVSDGGPTNWQAIIETLDKSDSYREFMFEFQDNQQAYTKDSRAEPDLYPEYFYGTNKGTNFRDSVNNSYRGWIDHEHVINPPPAQAGQFVTPELVSTGNRGSLSTNYRNAPLPLRVQGARQRSRAGDLAFVFSSLPTRGIASLNSQPTPGYIAKGKNKFTWPVQPISSGMLGGDPYTPLARAYNGDKIQVRTLVGSHVNPHFFNIHGVKWLFEPSFENSGWRSTQMMSISEHFEMNFRLPNAEGNGDGITDYLYKTSADMTGMQNGMWGLMRSYDSTQNNLQPLPNNPISRIDDARRNPAQAQNCGCPADARVREYDVTAISIDKHDILGKNWGKLLYNQTFRNFDSKAIIFLRTEDVHAFMHEPGFEPEPLVLRAAAGECIKVTLWNDITDKFVANSSAVGFSTSSNNQSGFPYTTSYIVGLHPELLSYDVSKYDGSNVGVNEPGKQTLPQGDGSVTYEWYAGQWVETSEGGYAAQPVEFGSCLLTPPDPLLQYVAGLFGAVIVEPAGTYWVEDKNEFTSYTSANVYESEAAFKNGAKPMFREFVMIFQDNLDLLAEPIGDHTGAIASAGLNYKSAPLGSRLFKDPEGDINFNQVDVSAITSNLTILNEPATPTFAATAGTPIRFRLLHPGGSGDGINFILHGHNWQEEPYTDGSTKLGNNELSQWLGYRGQLGSLNAFDLLINSAGGKFGVAGDYLYRDYRNAPFQNGTWGLFRVTSGKDAPIITSIDDDPVKNTFWGTNTVDPNTGFYATKVSLMNGSVEVASADVDQANGTWFMPDVNIPAGQPLTITSTLRDGSQGGSRTYSVEELEALGELPERVIMAPIVRPAAKQVEPGENNSRGQSRGRAPKRTPGHNTRINRK